MLYNQKAGKVPIIVVNSVYTQNRFGYERNCDVTSTMLPAAILIVLSK